MTTIESPGQVTCDWCDGIGGITTDEDAFGMPVYRDCPACAKPFRLAESVTQHQSGKPGDEHA